MGSVGSAVVLSVLVALGVCAVMLAPSWGGQCPKCSSVFTQRHVGKMVKGHNPRTVFMRAFSKCFRCKWIWRIEKKPKFQY